MIDQHTKLYGSFAKKAGSVGCKFFNTAFQQCGINAIYKSFSIENIEDAVKSAKTLDMKGFAITMPFKKEVLKYVDEIDKSAQIGAANTIINDNGKLTAYNTDFLAASDYLNKYPVNKFDFYILGDGGYALAVKTAAEMLGINYTNITRESWDQLGIIKNSLIYNCTPVDNITSIVSDSNTIIDCIVHTKTGRELATMQASYQFKLYTGLEFPTGDKNGKN